MQVRKTLGLVLAVLLVSCFLVSAVSAAEFQTDKSGTIAIGGNEKEVRNLYIAGNMLSINQNIKKDLLAAGNIITISNSVEDDLWAVGNTIVVRGDVGGSLRAAGSNLLIEGSVKEDVLVAGGNVTIAKSAAIGGDLIVAGGNLVVEGPVAGNILVNGGQLTINSKVGGLVKGTITDQLKLGAMAEIAKDLAYKSPKELEMADGAKVLGKTDYQKIEYKTGAGKQKSLAGLFTLGLLIKLLATLVAGLVLVYLLRQLTEPVVKKSLTHFWSSLGFGFAALILMPIAAIILFLTIIGSWLGGFVLLVYGLMMMLATPLAGIIAGSWLLKLIKKKPEYHPDWLAVVIGVVVLGLIALIPVVGWIICLIFFLISLGAIYRLVYQAITEK